MILQDPEQLSEKARRIISLVPSQTELLHYLGLERETIGLTKFCIHPREWYESKIRIGGTKNVDIERVVALKPDLIIANKEENVQAQVEHLAQYFPVWLTDVNNLENAYTMIADIGLLTGKSEIAYKLVHDISHAFYNFEPIHPGLRAAYLIWKDPYMVAGGGTFIDDMMTHAGFKNVFADKERYPRVTIDDIHAAGPQIILLSSEPYPFSEKNIADFKAAIPSAACMLVDGEMFSWYGSRLLLAPTYFSQLSL